MGKKVIKVGLSTKGINAAIKELERYEREIARKADTIRERVAERIQALAQSGFNGAVVDDLIGEGQRTADVKVDVTHGDNISIVITNGDDAIWVEFGAGVYHNGAVGSSPHPRGAEFGFTIGTYGKGFGARKAWGFRDEDGELHLTHGAPAVMPMYNAVKSVCNEIDSIAREVFK